MDNFGSSGNPGSNQNPFGNSNQIPGGHPSLRGASIGNIPAHLLEIPQHLIPSAGFAGDPQQLLNLQNFGGMNQDDGQLSLGDAWRFQQLMHPRNPSEQQQLLLAAAGAGGPLGGA
ncbi:unnamed protein product, partial [Heterosigma akashiwo]